MGLIPKTAQLWAGFRMDPPLSLPSPSGLSLAPMAAPSPPEDPPEVHAAFHGFGVRPKRLLSVWKSEASTGRFVLPMITAPAARRRATGVAS